MSINRLVYLEWQSDILVAILDNRIYNMYFVLPKRCLYLSWIKKMNKLSKVFLYFYNLMESNDVGRHSYLICYSKRIATIRRKDGAYITYKNFSYT